MTSLDVVAARVRGCSTVAELLDAAVEAFEAIRQVARVCEDRVPELFAAFMTAAGTAVEGRNALNDAPSLPPPSTGPLQVATEGAADDVGHTADHLAWLAALLARHLRRASAEAQAAGDRIACLDATQAATRIHWLLARDGDETCPR